MDADSSDSGADARAESVLSDPPVELPPLTADSWMGAPPVDGYSFPSGSLSTPVGALVQIVHELAPQVVYSGMAHVAAADPLADDLAVPVLASDAS
eukprot:11267289-Alexandrium_andersonii.AAC.1